MQPICCNLLVLVDNYAPHYKRGRPINQVRVKSHHLQIESNAIVCVHSHFPPFEARQRRKMKMFAEVNTLLTIIDVFKLNHAKAASLNRIHRILIIVSLAYFIVLTAIT